MRRRSLIAGALTLSLALTACGGDDPGEIDLEEAVDMDSDGEDAADADDDSPSPDPDDLEDPCADHQGREGELFIVLVSPVDGQVVDDEVELVGCSNVFEANVVWNLLDGDGVVLDEGFTTAECGTGCVGEFRETISLAAADGEPVGYLQVFSPNMADDGDAQLALTEVVLPLE